MISIYTLEKDNIPFYVGKTNRPLKDRVREHKHKLKEDIKILGLDEVNNNDWEWNERYWIEQLTSWGFILTNKNDGGGGPLNHSSQTKNKIGCSMKGQKRPTTSQKLKGQKITWDLTTSIPVLQFDLEGNLIGEHTSMGQASIKTNTPASSISLVCKGSRRTSKGFIWMYKKDWDGSKPQIRKHKSKGKPSNNLLGRPKTP